jgi:hypothetical protein
MGTNTTRLHRTRVIGARIVDLRAEFEAQLRAIVRVEEQLQNPANSDGGKRMLENVVRRELAQMVDNNGSVRAILNDLSKDLPPARE